MLNIGRFGQISLSKKIVKIRIFFAQGNTFVFEFVCGLIYQECSSAWFEISGCLVLMDCLFFHSWHHSVRTLGLIPNDEKSMWLLGDDKGEVQIAFLVSFKLLLPVM